MQIPTPEEWVADFKARLTMEKVSNTEVGAELGIIQSAISRILTGKVEARLSTMNRMEGALAAILARRLAE